MNRSLRSFLGLATLLISGWIFVALPTFAAPQINNQLNYQARLMDASGFPVADGNYSIQFSLYDAPTAGNRIWTASGTLGSPTTLTVNVQNGLFTVLLGDTGQNTLDTVDWNSDQLYLGVTVNADAEMSPRKRLAAAPQAFNARQLQGMYASSTVSGGQNLFTINQTENNAATSSRTALVVQSAGTSNANDFLIRGVNDLGASVFSVNRLGNVTSSFANVSSLIASSLVTSTQVNANIASFATATVSGVGVCLSNGVGCQSGLASETDTLQSVTARGSFTTTTAQFFGGFIAASSTVTGTLNIVDGTGRLLIDVASGNTDIMTMDAGHLAFGTNGFERWFISSTTGDLAPVTGGVYNLGSTIDRIATGFFINVSSTHVTTTSLIVSGQSVCLANGTNCPATTEADTLQSVTARGSFTTTTAEFFGGFVAASSSVTGTLNVAGTSNLLQNAYVGTSSYNGDLNSLFSVDGDDLFVAGNIGSVSSVYTNGAFVAGPGSTWFGDGFVTKTDGELIISTESVLSQPSISILAGDRASGLAGDVNVTAGNGLGGSPGGSIYLTPGDSLGNPGHLVFSPAGVSNQPQFRFESIGGGYVSLEAPNIAGSVNFVLPFADSASSTVLGTNGSGALSFVSVCLSDGTNCPAGSAETLQSVTARGSFTTTTAEFFGGFVAASSSVTGTLNVAGNVSVTGSMRLTNFSTSTPFLIQTAVPATGGFDSAQGLAIRTTGSALGLAASRVDAGSQFSLFAFSDDVSNVLTTTGTLALYNHTTNQFELSLYGQGGTTAGAKSVIGLYNLDAPGSSGALAAVRISNEATASSTAILRLRSDAQSHAINQHVGQNSPEGVIFDSAGSIFFSNGNTSGTQAYLKTSNDSNTGWKAIATVDMLSVGSGAELDTLADVSGRGAFTTTTLELFGGFTASTATVTSTASIQSLITPVNDNSYDFAQTQSIGGVSDVFVSEGYAYALASSTDSFNTVDVRRLPGATVQVGTLTVGDAPSSVYVSGRYAYVTNAGDDTLSIIDILHTEDAIVTATHPVGDSPSSVYVSGRYAYVTNAGDDTLSVIDITDPFDPLTVSTLAVGDAPSDVAVSGLYAFVTNSATDTLLMIDVSNPFAPITTSTITVGEGPSSVFVAGSYVFVTNETDDTLSIVDVAFTASPSVVETEPVGDAPVSVFVSGRYAYVANRDGSSYTVLDVSDPVISQVVATKSVSSNPTSIFVSDGYVFAADGNLQIWSIDGVQTNMLAADTARLGMLSVLGDGSITNSLQIGGSLTVGKGGVFSLGGFAAASGTTSTFADVLVGTSTYSINLHPAFSMNGDDLFVAGSIGSVSSIFTNGAFVAGTGTTIFGDGFISKINPGQLNISATSGIRFMDTIEQLWTTSSKMDITDSFAPYSNANTFLVKGNYAYVANASDIDVFDITDPSNIQLVDTVAGVTGYLAADERRLYVSAAGSGVSIYDISNPSNLTLVRQDLAFDGGYITIRGKYLYGVGGFFVPNFEIYEITPDALVSLGTFPAVSTGFAEPDIVGRYAYLKDEDDDILRVVDISDPTDPTQVGTLQLDDGASYRVSGNYAFVTDFNSNSLRSIDLNDPANPAFVATTTLSDFEDGVIRIMRVAGRYAYVLDSDDPGVDVLKIVDVQSPTSSMPIVKVIPGLAELSDFIVRGRYAYTLSQAKSGAGYFAVFDTHGTELQSLAAHSLWAGNLSVAGDAELSGRLSVSQGLQVGWQGIMSEGPLMVNASGTTSTFHGGVAIGTDLTVGGLSVCLSDGVNCPGGVELEIVDTVSTLSNPNDVVAVGNYAYVLDEGDRTLKIIDASNPTDAVVTGTLSLSASAAPAHVYVDGDYAYVTMSATSNTLSIIDVSNPASPTLVAIHPVGSGPTGVYAARGYAYVANATVDSLSIIDVSNPASPVTVATTTVGDTPEGVYGSGDYIYVTNNGSDSLTVINVVDPANPLVTDTVTGFFQPGDVFAGNGYAYVGNDQFGLSGLAIVDVSDPLNAFIATTTFAGQGASDVVVSGHYAYVTNYHAGAQHVSVVNIEDPLHPEYVSLSSAGSSPLALAISGRYAYIVNGFFSGTLQVAEISGENETDLYAVNGHIAFLDVSDQLTVGARLAIGTASSVAAVANNFTMALTYASSATVGGLCIDDTSTVTSCPTSGINGASIMADGAISSDAFDLAEMYSVTGTHEAGDVLVLDASSTATVMQSTGVPYDSKVIGIASTRPGFLLGWSGGAKVALTGRVPTKISMNNGSVAVGDALVASDVPGYAMKATRPGMILGYALENVSATGTGEVFVDVGFWAGLALGPGGQIQVDDSGNVSIMGDLHVGGRLFPSLQGGGIQNDWYLFVNDDGASSTYISTNADGWMSMDTYDFAERYYSPDELNPGDVVVVSDSGRTHVQRSMNEDQMLLGIVSTRPAFIAGRPATSTYPIALSGRVPTNVSNVNGAIKAGDPLAPTTIPGVVAKAVHTGPIVGLALEDFDSANVGQIEVFVNPTYWVNEQELAAPTSEASAPSQIIVSQGKQGFATIVAGAKKVRIEFPSLNAYPNVQVTPRGSISGGWWTDNYSDTGFEIILSEPEENHDVVFAWRVEATTAADVMRMSDGTYATVDPVTGMPVNWTTTSTEEIVPEPEMGSDAEPFPPIDQSEEVVDTEPEEEVGTETDSVVEIETTAGTEVETIETTAESISEDSSTSTSTP